MNFKIKKGRWFICNINDALVASKFDMFINKHRTLELLSLRAYIPTSSLKRHNYVYNIKK